MVEEGLEGGAEIVGAQFTHIVRVSSAASVAEASPLALPALFPLL